jgi:hypothetical protein
MNAEMITLSRIESTIRKPQILLTGRPFLECCSYAFFWSSCDSARRNITNFPEGSNGLEEQITNNCGDVIDRRLIDRTTKDLSDTCNLSRIR